MVKFLLLFFFVLLQLSLFSQTKIVMGKITDAITGEDLVGAGVVVKGTLQGTFSDVNGSYSIPVPASGGRLVFSFVGYEVTDTVIGLDNVINVALKPSVKLLYDVVIVGYGSQVREKMTGNISQVDDGSVNGKPVSTLEQTLQGNAAGLFIESNNGKIGADVRVRIRGSSSVNASNQPLYVVDGIPINTDAINDKYYIYLNPLNDINFNDIESVVVLKDASAAAIYGARGANGVILITTRRGKKGNAKIDFDIQYGFSKPTRMRKFLNADQYVAFFTQAAVNAGKYEWRKGLSIYPTEQETIEASVAQLNSNLERFSGGTPIGSVNTDWQSQAFQHAVSSNANLSVSGGNDALRYFISAGYSAQDGVLIENSGKRVSLRANLDATLSPKLTGGITFNLVRNENHELPSDNYFSTPLQIVSLSPITPLYNSSGGYNNSPVTTYPNPLVDVAGSQMGSITFRNLSNLYAEYHFTPELNLRGEAGADISNLRGSRFFGSQTQKGMGVGGYATNYSSGVENYNTKLILNYHRRFHASHTVEATTGTEYQRYDAEYSEVDGTGFPNDYLRTLSSASTIVTGQGTKNYHRFVSCFARVNYDYRSRYLLSVTGRYDGSSRFGENKKYGFFPSVSTGWLLSHEDFLMDNKTVSYLKLRASWGITGNAEIGDFNYSGLYGVSSYSGTPGLYPSTLSNPDLTWEPTTQTDFGIDFGFFRNRINGKFDYYMKYTNGLLLAVPLPATTGFSSQYQNVGKSQNHGYEIELNADIFTGKFTWSLGVNYSSNKNKVTALAPGQDLIDNSWCMNVVKTGEPIGVFYGAEYAGVDPDNGDALFYINDPEHPSRETTSDYNAAHFVVLGNPNPKFIAGMTNTLGWNNITLNFLLQGVYGNTVNLAGDIYMNGSGAFYDNQLVDALNYWKQPGDQAQNPEPRLGYGNGNQMRSSRYLSDGSYLRLKTVTLSYNLSKSWMQKLKIQNLQLYVSAYNLLTWTKYKGWDPEVTSDTFHDNIHIGLDLYSAPQPKTIVFGMKMSI